MERRRERRPVEVYGREGKRLGLFGLVSSLSVYVNGREETVRPHPEKDGAYIFVNESSDIQDFDMDPKSEAGRRAIKELYKRMQK